jgi:hypothetical protein
MIQMSLVNGIINLELILVCTAYRGYWLEAWSFKKPAILYLQWYSRDKGIFERPRFHIIHIKTLPMGEKALLLICWYTEGALWSGVLYYCWPRDNLRKRRLISSGISSYRCPSTPAKVAWEAGQ